MYYTKKAIEVFKSHIEVSPYEEGESETIERYMSIYENFSYDPVGYYVLNDVLYLPRGCNIAFLEKTFRTTAIYRRGSDEYDTFKWIDVTVPPRSKIQTDSIDFLCCKNEFSKYTGSSQQSLTLDTGDGKTYSAVYAILDYGMDAVIITYLDKIRSQWKDTFLTKTNMQEDDIVLINGSNDMDKVIAGKSVGHVYLVLHQTIGSYAKNNGWLSVREFFKKTKAGIKVIDEAHRYYENTIRIDMFSNTEKTFYLTANFERGERAENALFKKVFSSVVKFGEETKSYEEKRKHIIYVPVLYKSNPTAQQIMETSNFYGFSAVLFSEYALFGDCYGTLISKLKIVFNKALELEGKILITAPRIDDTTYLKEKIKDWLIGTEFENRTVETIHSKHTREENDDTAANADIIISTIKSCGTGVDIPKLRVIINLEPFSSNIISNQLSGRLREYAKDKYTYFFDLIDTSFPNCERQYMSKLRFLKKKCKEINIWNL